MHLNMLNLIIFAKTPFPEKVTLIDFSDKALASVGALPSHLQAVQRPARRQEQADTPVHLEI